VSGPEV